MKNNWFELWTVGMLIIICFNTILLINIFN